jgi:hypothetical protein
MSKLAVLVVNSCGNVVNVWQYKIEINIKVFKIKFNHLK